MEHDLIEVTVKTAEPDFATGQFKIVLRDNETGQIMTILVGPFEGHAILLGLEETWAPRPMTHDLIVSLIGHMQAQAERVIITELRDNTFYAVIHLVVAGKTITVDCPARVLSIAFSCPGRKELNPQ